LRARAWKSGMPASNVDGVVYTFKAQSVNIVPGTNIYNTDQTATLTSSSSGVTIHYTTNGNDPTVSDPALANGGTLAISQTTTLQARAFKSGWTTSDMSSATFTMKVATPTSS